MTWITRFAFVLHVPCVIFGARKSCSHPKIFKVFGFSVSRENPFLKHTPSGAGTAKHVPVF